MGKELPQVIFQHNTANKFLLKARNIFAHLVIFTSIYVDSSQLFHICFTCILVSVRCHQGKIHFSFLLHFFFYNVVCLMWHHCLTDTYVKPPVHEGIKEMHTCEHSAQRSRVPESTAMLAAVWYCTYAQCAFCLNANVSLQIWCVRETPIKLKVRTMDLTIIFMLSCFWEATSRCENVGRVSTSFSQLK